MVPRGSEVAAGGCWNNAHCGHGDTGEVEVFRGAVIPGVSGIIALNSWLIPFRRFVASDITCNVAVLS